MFRLCQTVGGRYIVSKSSSALTCRAIQSSASSSKSVDQSDASSSNFASKSDSLEKRKDKEVEIVTPIVPERELCRVMGIPEEHVYERRARIFKPSKNAMQSGTANLDIWLLEFENRERWENPLMGWGSTGDPLSNVQLKFPNKEAAIAYCEKIQYPYFVELPAAERKPRRKSYADNFSWDKRTRVGSK
ncbi:NADH:ubiquinone oxidoreductase subunit 18 [Brevipalpus obovatus]|uniref:NADH:ubiquinone oxidoreductase subunit 18 n=1 Tax=Brevipalpus obovatus TaxID=246614 RepID=UPI003D9E4D11